MKIGVISDIHANAPALRVVLDGLVESGVDQILCAGDAVGYYPFPNEVVSLLQKHDVRSIIGNHDAAVLDETPSEFSINAKRAADWTRRQLTPESKAYLKSLHLAFEETIDDREIYMVHGSPDDPLNEYIWEEEVNERALDFWFDDRPELVILGHTHRPFVKEISSTTVLNPGSVGQPRDRNPRSAFAVVDLETLAVNRYRVDYDIDAVADKTGEYLPRKLADRLYEGR
ncbi:metallophosphoesterase family protein [Natrinema soli]|uniref:Phosphoesterase n=1 Tax=Natrinema soli TaxID=1930624 RepID=A0ABD5SR10_9EURY|nr:metallophosphoesterase family protein [Natrinema soli]